MNAARIGLYSYTCILNPVCTDIMWFSHMESGNLTELWCTQSAMKQEMKQEMKQPLRYVRMSFTMCDGYIYIVCMHRLHSIDPTHCTESAC